MDRRALLGLAALAAAEPAPVRAGEGHGGAPQASYIRLATITANIRRPDGRRGIMTVETGVDVPDAALRLRAQQSIPRLQAAYTAVIQQTASALLPAAPPDVERLVAQLQAATDRALGRAGARLLIGTVMLI